MKGYHQYCGVARSLDVLGERWTLLLIREFLLGPRRYSDLLEALPGLTTNLLAKRLAHLEAEGVIEKVVLPAPAKSKAYALSESGAELEPIIMALGAWGERRLAGGPKAGDRMNPGWALLSRKRRYRGGLELVVELHVVGRQFQLWYDLQKLTVREGGGRLPDIVLRTTLPGFKQLLFASPQPQNLPEGEDVELEGPFEGYLTFLQALGRVDAPGLAGGVSLWWDTVRAFVWACALVALLCPLGAHAASEADLKLVVPRPSGKKSWGGRALARSLRKELSQKFQLISEKNYQKARKKLRISKSRAKKADSITRIGAKAGADYVLSVSITRQKWLYTARAQLLNTQTGEVQMDFRSQYYKPKSEARDRGQRIARKTIEKIGILFKEGATPQLASPAPVAQNDSSTPAEDPPPDDSLTSVVEDSSPSGGSSSDLKEDPPPPSSSSDLKEEPRSVASQGQGSSQQTQKAAPPPPRRKTAPASVQSRQSPSSSAQKGNQEIIRVSLSAGAGLLRSYQLSAPSLDSSSLSYQLNPLSLAVLRAEFFTPGIPLTIQLRSAFRPVQYEVSGDNGDTNTPSGLILDGQLSLGWMIDLYQEYSRRFSVIPKVGARYYSSTADAHPGPIVVDSSAITAFAGLMGRFAFNEMLELDLGFDGGMILSYEESPKNTGSSNGGFSLGGDLNARIWLNETFAVAFDNRFSYDSVSFTGTPSRILPLNETNQLRDASLSLRDLRSSLGIAVKF